MSTERVRKIVGATAIRADYDLLSGIYRALHARSDVNVGLLVSGAHLAPTFGYSVEEIRRDGLSVLAEIESLIDSNTPSSRIKTASIGMLSMIDVLAQHRPDVVLYAGDRENELVLAAICAYLKIPTIHFFGGDHATDGNVDNSVRHAISKLSTFHFVVHETHRRRLLRIGESPERIHVVGNPALDKFRDEPWLVKEDVLRAFPGATCTSGSDYAVMIHHPILSESERAADEAKAILDALMMKGIPTFVSSPNTDSGSRDILQVYERHRKIRQFTFYRNLPRCTFINLLRHARFLIGNSSLGLLEAPSIPLAAINVGHRQQGRLHTDNVVFVEAESEGILQAIEQVCTEEFAKKLVNITNPFGDGFAVRRAVDLILTLDYDKWLFKREDPLERGGTA